jgi:A/G-specific adenine glycosylase
MLQGPPLIRFRKKLLAWFAQFRRDLPWRRTKDPYRIWLAEIMLQQTRVAAVVPYYERFLEHFPDVKALAEAREGEVLRHWAGLGYYSRVRNLQKAAQQIVKEHQSRFPETRDETLKLAGIGEYTAAAILSIAYGKKFAALDGNVARVLARLTALRGDLRSDGRWSKSQKLANEFMAPKAPGDWNEAMMELGATICTPRAPQCLLCPVAEFCRARKLGLTNAIPEKRKKRDAVHVNLAALALVDGKARTLLLPPPKNSLPSAQGQDIAGLLSRLWHFPTIRVERAAEPELRKFARQTLLEGQALRANLVPLATVRHTVTYRLITVQPFRMDVKKLPAIRGAKKLPLHELNRVAISNLTRKVARVALSECSRTVQRKVRQCRIYNSDPS